MKGLFKTLSSLSFVQILRRALFRLRGSVLTFHPSGYSRGNVLISYTTVPFTLLAQDQMGGHTNYWETRDMVQAFLEHGYSVDVIDFTNRSFVPAKPYRYFIDIDSNMERLAALLNKDCVKIFHATGSHWAFNNRAEEERLEALEKRRGVRLAARRAIAANRSAECADVISTLCGPLPRSTYDFAGKEQSPIPLSTTHTYQAPEHKDFGRVRTNFVWFGGAGAVHKGLDLVLEAFAAMPQYTLTVCGKLNEADFVDEYRTELFDTPNIKCVGYVDPGSDIFKKICDESLGVVFASCAEGCAGSVVVAMHAGLVPVVSPQSGVETGSFGITLPQNSIEETKSAVQKLATETPDQLKGRAMGAWRYARAHHTREQFARAWRGFVDTLETTYAR